MSIEATWDLKSGASSPRSVCVHSASDSSNNPFDHESSSAVAVVVGDDAGGLHYRTFAPIHRANRGGLSKASPPRSTASSSSVVQVPLGLSRTSSSQLPRSYYPVDLKSSLPGSVVAVLELTKRNNAVFYLLLVDDHRGSSASQPGAYAAHIATLHQGTFHILSSSSSSSLPRMSSAVYHPTTGVVYGAGRTLATLSPDVWEEDSAKHRRYRQRLVFTKLIPAPGLRAGQGGVGLTAGGKVALVIVGNTVYGIPGQEADEEQALANVEWTRVLSFTQSSQVHPVIILDTGDESLDADWSCILLANGRECAVVDLYYGPPSAPRLSANKPRHGVVTLASPILAAAESWPWVAVLTSDGLISIRSPSCLAIPLRTVEVGNRPNDYFCLRTLADETQAAPWIVAASYSGQAKVLQCQPDTAQDLADRLMRHAIDAFGAHGFPRAELAEAVHASFTATSYVGPEATPKARALLQQYLEAVLGLADWESGGTSGWPTELASGEGHHGAFGDGSNSGRGAPPTVVSASTPAALLTGSALMCLVCLQLSPPNSSLASRAALACAEKMGVIISGVSDAAIGVCEMVADKLLREASSSFSLLSGSSPTPIARGPRSSQSAMYTDFVEASIWLLRACGKHERALDVTYERLHRQGQAQGDVPANTRGAWSEIKYESYTATHLSDLWASGSDDGCRLVIRSPSTYRVLETNPRLGLSVFTSVHPQNEGQWRVMRARDDPLARPDVVKEVIKLLMSINPAIPYNAEPTPITDDGVLPLESGRALAVTYLESAIGIETGRPTEDDVFETLPPDQQLEEQVIGFHDELAFLLLEGVILERRDDETGDNDTPLGHVYRSKLRRFLRWPLAKLRPDTFMKSLPPSFLQEKALILGRLGRHEDALRILYRDLHNLDLALEYCDGRHEQLRIQQERVRAQQQRPSSMFDDFEQEPMKEEDNAYLPLVRVALESEDTERGTAAAIQVLALRRSAIDRAAALRLLPSDVPVSAVARPFLIPALVDSESHVRRLTVVSALLRARYMRLKGQLTEAQLKAQANLHVVPQLRSLNLGDPLHSTNPFRARTNTPAGSTMPDVMIVKHFFPRHLVIQAKVTNSVGLSAKYVRTLSDVAFVVAESSEEAIQPLLQVPIQVLPAKMTGCAWCVLSAAPTRMDGPVAQLTCELRYTVQSVEASQAGAAPAMGVMGRTYVEELQDLEVHASHFS